MGVKIQGEGAEKVTTSPLLRNKDSEIRKWWVRVARAVRESEAGEGAVHREVLGVGFWRACLGKVSEMTSEPEGSEGGGIYLNAWGDNRLCV